MLFTPEFVTIRDEVTTTRAGTVDRFKQVVFYLGKFGPFTERFPLEEFSDLAVKTRMDALTRQLENLHR